MSFASLEWSKRLGLSGLDADRGELPLKIGNLGIDIVFSHRLSVLLGWLVRRTFVVRSSALNRRSLRTYFLTYLAVRRKWPNNSEKIATRGA